MKNYREKVLEWGPCLLIFLLPLLWFGNRVFPHVASKTFFFYGVVEILAAVWLYNILTDRDYRLSKKTLLFFIPIGLFIFWMTLAGVFGANLELSFWSSLGRGTGLLTLYHALLLGLIIASLTKHKGISYAYSFMEWMIAGALLGAISIWFGNDFFTLPLRMLTEGGSGGTFGNSSLAASYFMFALAFACILLARKKEGKQKKWAYVAIIVLILFCPILINVQGFIIGKSLLGTARAALLGIVVAFGTGILTMLVLSKRRLVRSLGILGIIASIIVFSLLWIRLVTPGTPIHQKFAQVATGTRFIFWDTAKKAMDDHPWFGYGPENYMIAWAYHFNPRMLLKENNFEVWTDRAHNIYYDTGVSGGYPAIMFYTLFILSIIYGAYLGYKKGSFSKTQTVVIIGFIAGYIFQNLFYFDSTLSMATLFSLAGIIFGMQGGAIVKDQKQKVPYAHEGMRIFYALLLLIAFCAEWITFAWRPAQKATDFARIPNMSTSERSLYYNELLDGSPIGNQWNVSGFAHILYKAYATNPESIKNDTKALPYVEKDLTSFLGYLEKITQKNKTDYRLYLIMVHLYSTYVYFTDKASLPLKEHMLSLLEYAKTLSPTDPQIYWATAQIDGWNDNFEGMEGAYKKAIDLDPGLPISHQLLIKFADRTKNKKLYQSALEEAKKDIPNFTLD